MSTVALDLNEIRQLQAGSVASSRFAALAHEINQLTVRVGKDWNSFPPEDQAALKNLAYSLVEPPKGFDIEPQPLPDQLQIQKQEKALYLCCEALDKLIDSIFSQIEQSVGQNPSEAVRMYQQHLADTLNEIKRDPNSGEPLQSGEVRDWLRKISDQALDEV